jgi:hypothetical protein
LEIWVMGIIEWAALRQVEALKESVGTVLQSGAIGHSGHDLTADMVRAWLREQNMGEILSGAPDEFVHVRTALLLYFISNSGGDVDDVIDTLRAANASSHEELEDIGVERSGAGWQRLDNFIITSGFVRVLGAFEQFQMDTLKALLYYRPDSALGHPVDQDFFTVTDDVIKGV